MPFKFDGARGPGAAESADSLGILEKRYGFQIFLKNIMQFRVIGPDTKLAGAEIQLTPQALDQHIARYKVEWKYRGKGFDSRLDPIIEALEWSQYAQGMTQLSPLRKNFNKALAESANKRYDALVKEGEVSKAEADSLAQSDPIRAYDLNVRIAVAFAGDLLGKSVQPAPKTPAANKAVSSELAARKSFVTIEAGLSRTTRMQKPLAIKTLQDFGKRYTGTPTGDNAATLAKELGG